MAPKQCKLENDMKTQLFSETCRVCMTRSSDMIQIFDIENDTLDKIHFCTGLQFTKEDGMPTHICNQCDKNLSVAHIFKTTCLQSDTIFHKMLNNDTIKEEVDNDDDYNDDMCSDGDYPDNTNVKMELYDVDVEKETDREHTDIDEEPKTDKLHGRLRRKVRCKPRKKMKFRRLYCVPCSSQFKSKLEFEQHKQDKHKEPECWICEICGKVFVHRSSHYSHIRSHQQPRYGCEQCDYNTWHKHDLTKHQRIHAGDKRYQCELCSCSFYNSSNLVCHRRRVHEGIRPYGCHLCDMRFYDKTKLNRHIDSHNDIKRFECEVCHSCFTRRCYWKKHMEKNHNVVIPRQRPGRQKINHIVGTLPESKIDNLNIDLNTGSVES